MHQRGMGYIGMIVAMVIAGLIVYGLIYYGPEIWHRTQEAERRGPTISDLVNNPTQYDGQNVVVVGDLFTAGLVVGPVDGYAYLGFRVVDGDYYLNIYSGAGTMIQSDWLGTGRLKVTGVFRSPNNILATKIEKA